MRLVTTNGKKVLLTKRIMLNLHRHAALHIDPFHRAVELPGPPGPKGVARSHALMLQMSSAILRVALSAAAPITTLGNALMPPNTPLREVGVLQPIVVVVVVAALVVASEDVVSISD